MSNGSLSIDDVIRRSFCFRSENCEQIAAWKFAADESACEHFRCDSLLIMNFSSSIIVRRMKHRQHRQEIERSSSEFRIYMIRIANDLYVVKLPLKASGIECIGPYRKNLL